MRLILKQFPSFLYNPINMIDWEICFHNIIFCNEDYESLIQSLIQITWFGDIRINQCAVVSGPLRASTFVTPLNLYIKYTAMTIGSKNVQSYGPALQVLDATLTVHFQNVDVFIVQDDPKQQFRARDIFKYFRHEVIIQ